jgi:hypothetical protein
VPRAFAALFDARKGGDPSKRRDWLPIVNVSSIAGEPYQVRNNDDVCCETIDARPCSW